MNKKADKIAAKLLALLERNAGRTGTCDVCGKRRVVESVGKRHAVCKRCQKKGA